MRATLLLPFALLATIPTDANAQKRDVPYYIARPAERHATLQRCRTDAALADTVECRNARVAGAADLLSPRALDEMVIPHFRGLPWEPRTAPQPPARQMPASNPKGASRERRT